MNISSELDVLPDYVAYLRFLWHDFGIFYFKGWEEELKEPYNDQLKNNLIFLLKKILLGTSFDHTWSLFLLSNFSQSEDQKGDLINFSPSEIKRIWTLLIGNKDTIAYDLKTISSTITSFLPWGHSMLPSL